MIYKIIVDKQPMTNPSGDKKEYTIDIAPLYFKHDVYDSIVITRDEDYVMRRLELTDYNVLVELDPPVKEPLSDITIELFEGDNYIYLYDMTGNKIVAQYLVKNEFNELYVLQSEMNSAITQSASAIELYVQQNYETLSHATSEYARIDLNAQGISTEVSKKVGNNEVISKINQSAEAITINANKLNLTGYITATNLSTAGQTTINGGNITTGSINANRISGGQLKVSGYTSGSPFVEFGNPKGSFPNIYGTIIWDNGLTVMDYRYNNSPIIKTENNDGYAELNGAYVNAFGFNNVSLEEKKKDFELLKSGLNIIKDIDIYKYNYKDEKDKKKHIGIVIGDKYKYSKEITSDNNEEIDIYSFVSVCCKAIQEQQEQIEELKEKLKKLEKGDK